MGIVSGGGGGGGVANPMTADLNAGTHDITNIGEVDAHELDVDQLSSNVAAFVTLISSINTDGHNTYGGNPSTSFSPTTLALSNSSDGGNAQLIAGDGSPGDAGGNVELDAGSGGSPGFGGRAQVRVHGGQSDGTHGRLELFTNNSGGSVGQALVTDGLGTVVFGTLGAVKNDSHAAPADGAIAAGELYLWFDQTNGAAKLMVKAKQANGTVVAASIALA